MRSAGSEMIHGSRRYELLSIETHPSNGGMLRGLKIHDTANRGHLFEKMLWSAERDFSAIPDLSCENPLLGNFCLLLRFLLIVQLC